MASKGRLSFLANRALARVSAKLSLLQGLYMELTVFSEASHGLTHVIGGIQVFGRSPVHMFVSFLRSKVRFR